MILKFLRFIKLNTFKGRKLFITLTSSISLNHLLSNCAWNYSAVYTIFLITSELVTKHLPIFTISSLIICRRQTFSVGDIQEDKVLTLPPAPLPLTMDEIRTKAKIVVRIHCLIFIVED